MDAGLITVNGSVYPIKRATFSIASGANSDVVAAVTAKKIRVLSLIGTTISATAAGFKFRSNTTDLTPEMFTITTGGPIVVLDSPNIAETVAGEALNVIVSGNTFNGVILYVELT